MMELNFNYEFTVRVLLGFSDPTDIWKPSVRYFQGAAEA